MKMPLKVTSAAVLDGSRLALTFSDGSAGIADLATDVLEDDLRALADPAFFSMAHINGSSVSWSDDIDLAAEFLYARAHDLKPPKTAADVEGNLLEVTLRQLRELVG